MNIMNLYSDKIKKSDEKVQIFIEKIFHDLGNTVSFLNFYIELNKENPKNADFKELIDINRRLMLQFKVLKYAFLEGYSSENGLECIKNYFLYKDIFINFNISNLLLTREDLKLLTNLFMVIEKAIPGSALTVAQEGDLILIECTSKRKMDNNDLKVFTDLNPSNINISFIKDILDSTSRKLSYKKESDFKVNIAIDAL